MFSLPPIKHTPVKLVPISNASVCLAALMGAAFSNSNASDLTDLKYMHLALGIPFLRHLETACDEISQSLATAIVPPNLSIKFKSSIYSMTTIATIVTN